MMALVFIDRKTRRHVFLSMYLRGLFNQIIPDNIHFLNLQVVSSQLTAFMLTVSNSCLQLSSYKNPLSYTSLKQRLAFQDSRSYTSSWL